jgi:hypothetical protein
MAVINGREVTGRSFTHEFGDFPTAERRFVVTLNSPDTPTQDIINYVGIPHLAAHPEYPYLRMINATVTEASPTPFHAEVTCSYGVPGLEERDPNPLNRPDVWSFSTSAAAVPAFFYYDNNVRKVLTNTAGDFFEGAQTEESEVRATIQSNRLAFPLSLAIQVTGCVNQGGYIGAPEHYWKCAGISASRAVEVVNDVEVNYWQVTSELVYRQSGWPLQLPNVGYNCIEGGEKVRAYVKNPDDTSEKIPCASPIALNQDGSIKTSGVPDILVRRVNLAVPFVPLFGTPPTS